MEQTELPVCWLRLFTCTVRAIRL